MTVGIAIAGLFGVQAPEPTVGATIPVSTAVFQTSLQNSIGTSDTSMTLVTGTNKAGNSLSGYMCFNIDEGTSLEEFVCGTVSGTAVTSMLRGIDPVDGDTEVTALKKSHRRGASVKITDYPSIAIVSRILNGDETIPNALTYAGATTCASNAQLCPKSYVDGVAVAGASNADTTTKGIVEEATQAEVDARTTTGGTAAKLFAPLDKIRASKYHDYAADAGANDTYTATVTPAPTAYATGQIFQFKANTLNTGAATVNFNSLGAKTIKKHGNTDLETGDILANQIVQVQYDGTNMQLQSETAVSKSIKISQDGAQIYASSTSGNDTYAVTLSPVPAAYTTGMVVNFKVDTANTGTATINVNSLGAKTIKKDVSSDLETGDILANTIISAVYDGTNFQLSSRTPLGGFFNSVVNTEATAGTWYTWVSNFFGITTSGPTYEIPGWVHGGLSTFNNNKGGGGVTTISGSPQQVYASLPGNGSNQNYTAASSKDLKFKWSLLLANMGSNNYLSFGFVDAAATLDDIETSTSESVRFVLDNTTMYAVTSNGASNTSTTVSVTHTNWNIFEIVFNPGTDAKFYINGTLVATITTTLPTGSLQMFGIGWDDATTIYVKPITFSLEQ